MREHSNAGSRCGEFDDNFGQRHFDDAGRFYTRRSEDFVEQNALMSRRINQHRFVGQVTRPNFSSSAGVMPIE